MPPDCKTWYDLNSSPNPLVGHAHTLATALKGRSFGLLLVLPHGGSSVLIITARGRRKERGARQGMGGEGEEEGEPSLLEAAALAIPTPRCRLVVPCLPKPVGKLFP